MLKEDVVIPIKQVVSRIRRATGRLARHGIPIIATLLLLLAGQAAQAQVQTIARFTVEVDSPRLVFCLHQKATYHVHVLIDGARGPDDPPDAAYLSLRTGEIVTANVGNSTIIKLISAYSMTNYNPDPDLAISDTVAFDVQATKVGTTTITFTASVVGTPAKSTQIAVKVQPCRFQVFGVSSWEIPFPGGTFDVSAYLKQVSLSPDNNGNLSGSTSAVWQPTVKGPPCGFPYTIQPTPVKVTGSVDNDGYIHVNLAYGPANQTENANCLQYHDTNTHTITVDKLDFQSPYADNVSKLEHSIIAPETVEGKAQMYIKVDTSSQ